MLSELNPLQYHFFEIPYLLLTIPEIVLPLLVLLEARFPLPYFSLLLTAGAKGRKGTYSGIILKNPSLFDGGASRGEYHLSCVPDTHLKRQRKAPI